MSTPSCHITLVHIPNVPEQPLIIKEDGSLCQNKNNRDTMYRFFYWLITIPFIVILMLVDMYRSTKGKDKASIRSVD